MKMMIEFLWIPSELGGHTGEPYQEMRTELIPQRQLSASFSNTPIHEASWNILSFDSKQMRGVAECALRKLTANDISWFESGQQVQARNGSRILAVGVVR